MLNFIRILIISILFVLFTACTESTTENKSSSKKIERNSQQIKEISVKDLSKAFLDEHLIIDVRELPELQAGVIPNSVHIPMGMIDTKLPEYLQSSSQAKNLTALKDKPILLYCAGGVRSYRSAETLKKLGFTNLTSLEGGFNTYKSENKLNP